MRLFWFSAILVFLLDRITKFYVLGLSSYNRFVERVCSCFNIVKCWNKGVVFGLFSNAGSIANYVFLVTTLIFLLICFFWAKKVEKKGDKLYLFALGMLFGGGLGNLFDRIFYKGVFDFIDLHIKNYHWPAFNIADAGITLSILIILYKSFK